jgi:hypothetical protein
MQCAATPDYRIADSPCGHDGALLAATHVETKAYTCVSMLESELWQQSHTHDWDGQK